MKVYEVHNAAEFGSAYYLTKADALREAKACVTDDPEQHAVYLLETIKTNKHGILAMIRGRNWVVKRTRVWPRDVSQEV